jgi:type I restriction enzyme S subunit
MIPDLSFRAVFRADSPIDPRYLAEVMKTPHLRQQVEAVATGSSPTMKKISKPGLLSLQLPLPPLPIQKQLVAQVTAAREQIANERAAAAKLAADTRARRRR